MFIASFFPVLEVINASAHKPNLTVNLQCLEKFSEVVVNATSRVVVGATSGEVVVELILCHHGVLLYYIRYAK